LLNCFEALKKRGIQCCTVYGFSTENWRRSRDEVRDILTVIEGTARKFEHRAIEEGVRVKILGDMTDERLPRSLSNALLSLESKTHAATKHLESDDCLTVCLAVNYGGRHDILNASIKLATRIVEEMLDPKSLTESDFAVCLYTATIPEPDLVVRTGGDQRLSNFLLWDVSYAELYFTDVLWPDFDETELSRALSWFANRSRRFGGRKIPAFESLT
jgi:undecaprenyl diphosphate synthase